jgi:hypothetical protein
MKDERKTCTFEHTTLSVNKSITQLYERVNSLRTGTI